MLVMKKKHILFLFFFFLFTAQSYSQNNKAEPIKLILDTDMGPDYDDVGAMAVLHALADSGQVKILATMGCNQSKYVAPVLDLLNTYYGRPNMPIGIVRGRAVHLASWQKWDSLLADKYPHDLKTNNQAANALSLYRKILAGEPDKSITIVTIGFLTNMADLLLSKPDRYSPLSGTELVRKKVAKLFCMAGKFPQGKEFNVDRDPVSSKIVFDNWPTDIVFSGWEIGSAVHTGLPIVQNDAVKNSPVKDVFTRCIPMEAIDSTGRMSWDETAVLVSIKGYENYYTVTEGRFVCSEDGSNKWNTNGKGHFYLVEKMPVPQMEKTLNDLIMHQPTKN
jgi:pyrimidine-specific ribonucleoside hydrolase